MNNTEVVVVGAGQAGLSSAYHLRRTGFEVVEVRDAPDRPGAEWVYLARAV